MRRASIPVLLIGLVLIAAPVVAGGAECQKAAQAARAGRPCEMTAEECQTWMAEAKQRPWLGVDLDIDRATAVPTVRRVVPDSPAQRAGFHAGDRLVALNGVPYGTASEAPLAATMSELRFGDTVTYTVQRNGAEQKLTATLTRMPDSVYVAMVDEHKKEHAELASR